MKKKNDLTPFEKNLLRAINFENGTNYNFNHLMEWNTREDSVTKNLQPNEIVYKALGAFVAIKPTPL